MSAYVSCGISINISSTEAARFFGNPILSANRSKSSLQGCNVLSYTSLFSISGERPSISPRSLPLWIWMQVLIRSYAGARKYSPFLFSFFWSFKYKLPDGIHAANHLQHSEEVAFVHLPCSAQCPAVSTFWLLGKLTDTGGVLPSARKASS